MPAKRGSLFGAMHVGAGPMYANEPRPPERLSPVSADVTPVARVGSSWLTADAKERGRKLREASVWGKRERERTEREGGKYQPSAPSLWRSLHRIYHYFGGRLFYFSYISFWVLSPLCVWDCNGSSWFPSVNGSHQRSFLLWFGCYLFEEFTLSVQVTRRHKLTEGLHSRSCPLSFQSDFRMI